MKSSELRCTKLIFLISIWIVCTSRVCFKDPECYCRKTSKQLKIYCIKVSDISKLQKFLYTKFNDQKINNLRIAGCSVESLPRNAFNTLLIEKLAIICPLKDLPDDALSGIQNLNELYLATTKFSTVPAAAANLPLLQVLQMYSGNLISIENQLQNTTAATTLQLNKNKIGRISTTAFQSVRSLEKLDLSQNQLTYLDSSTLKPLKMLQVINLSGNQLHTVEGLFENLNPLEIDLSRNNLSILDNVFATSMEHLAKLTLSHNPLMYLNASVFNEQLLGLQTLILSDCQFTELDENLLTQFPRLSELRVNKNSIERFPKGFFRHANVLGTIDASDNFFDSLNDLPNSVYAKYLDFHGNNITSIGDALNTVPRLLELDLSGNRINAVFHSDFQLTPSLQLLNLSGNNITRLDSDCFRNLKELRTLDLSYNVNLRRLNNSLQKSPVVKLHLNSTSLEVLEAEDFSGMTRLGYVSLRNNQISSVYKVFGNLKSIKVVDLAGNNISTLTKNSFMSVHNVWLFLEDNPWACDCRLQWLIEFFSFHNGTRLNDEPVCHSPENLLNKTLRNLTVSDVTSWKEHCPDSCSCTCLSNDQFIYTRINCSGKGLQKVPEDLPNNAREVYLSRNRIMGFGDATWKRFSDLTYLDLESNALGNVRLNLPPKLNVLKLAGNSMSKFPYTDLGNQSLSVITLSGNKWSCSCDAYEFRNWLLWNNESVMDLNDVRCADNGGNFLKGKVIVDLNYDDFCSHEYLNIIVTIVGTIVVFSLIALSCYCRRGLAALLYSCGFTCLKKEQSTSEPFDAFLLFSIKDEEFATLEIARELESCEYQFNLCVAGRDIQLTGNIDANVRSVLAESSKIIMILTKNFLSDSQCMNVFRASLSFSLEDTANHVIVVKKGDVPPTSEMNTLLETVVRASPCVTWGECVFWKKLKYAMPKKPKKPCTVGLMEDA